MSDQQLVELLANVLSIIFLFSASRAVQATIDAHDRSPITPADLDVKR